MIFTKIGETVAPQGHRTLNRNAAYGKIVEIIV
jgi:hypothetical protein